MKRMRAVGFAGLASALDAECFYMAIDFAGVASGYMVNVR